MSYPPPSALSHFVLECKTKRPGVQAEGTPIPLDGGVVDVGPWRITTSEGERKAPEVGGGRAIQNTHGTGV